MFNKNPYQHVLDDPKGQQLRYMEDMEEIQSKGGNGTRIFIKKGVIDKEKLRQELSKAGGEIIEFDPGTLIAIEGIRMTAPPTLHKFPCPCCGKNCLHNLRASKKFLGFDLACRYCGAEFKYTNEAGAEKEEN